MAYYALQVTTHKEKDFVDMAKVIDGCEFIYINRELKVYKNGHFVKEVQPAFLGYVFIKTEYEITADLCCKIKKLKYFYRFLKSNQDITPLNENDLAILQHFLKLGQTIGISKVYFTENDRIVVDSGALKGLEGNIIKVDKRKHRAKIRLDFENSPMVLDLAFDTISKAEATKKDKS